MVKIREIFKSVRPVLLDKAASKSVSLAKPKQTSINKIIAKQ